MFVERLVSYSALFTFLVRWHASAVSSPPGDVILAQLACPLNDHHFLFTRVITILFLYKHWVNHPYIRTSQIRNILQHRLLNKASQLNFTIKYNFKFEFWQETTLNIITKHQIPFKQLELGSVNIILPRAVSRQIIKFENASDYKKEARGGFVEHLSWT